MDSVTADRDMAEIGRLVVITGLPGSGRTTLATELATAMPAVRMSPDEWMMSGIDLWNSLLRDRIEQFQLDLALDLLREGRNVVLEWESRPPARPSKRSRVGRVIIDVAQHAGLQTSSRT